MSNRTVAACAALILLVGALRPAPLRAQVPWTLAYSGYLEEAGAPLHGAAALRFELYTSDFGGSLVWSETFDSVAVSAGSFHVDLGRQPGAELDAAVFSGAPLWLAVAVNDEPLAPRTAITTVPYAFRAAVCSSAESVPWSAIVDVPADLADGDDDTQRSQATIESYIANDVDTGYLPYDDGTRLSSSNVFYDGSNLGVGTATPASALDVAGAIHASQAVSAAELCIVDACRSTWPVDGLTACSQCDSRFLQSETDPSVADWAKGGACPCGTCWATRTTTADCSDVHRELCTPTGWKQTGDSTNQCP